MEGVAFLERLGIERLEQLGLRVGPTMFATGGGAASETWLRIRASVNRRVRMPCREHAECAVGAAVLAAMPHCGSYAAAAAAIIRAGRRVEPDPRLAAAYDEAIRAVVAALRAEGLPVSIFKACDIRGVVGSELDESLMLRIGRSLGGLLRAAQRSPRSASAAISAAARRRCSGP